MKKIGFIATLVIVSSIAQAQTWTLDKAHAKLGFGITHMMISEVEGTFKTFDVKFISNKDDLSDAVIELSSDVSSINTDNEKRDTHLKSPDFFDAAKYPTMTFKSKSFTKVEGKKYKLTGNLTMHGVTKPVELDVICNIGVNPYSKKTTAGFKITGTLKRSDYGIGSGFTSVMLSDEVTINANVELIKEETPTGSK